MSLSEPKLALAALFVLAYTAHSQVTINPGDNIQSKINANPAGTTFTISAGTYRITSPLVPKSNDSFIGQSACNPIVTPGSCTAIISGSTVIGPSATFDGTNYEVSGQTQQGTTYPTSDCISGYLGCVYPEDLFFDGVPLQHLYSSTLPTIGAGQWWFDYTNHIIYFHDNPNGHTVETSVSPGAFIEGTSGTGANNVKIQYLTFQQFAVPISTAGGIWPWSHSGSDSYRQSNGVNWIIEECEFWGHHGSPVNPNYGMQILNSYLHDNGECGICGWGTTSNGVSSSILIQGNYITHNNANNYSNVSPGVGSGGIKFGSITSPTIRDNLIINNDGAGIHFDVSSCGGLVDGNTITGNTDADGFEYEIGSTKGSPCASVVRNNIVIHNGNQVLQANQAYQIRSQDSEYVQAYCNVTEAQHSSGIAAWVVGASNRGNDSGGGYYKSVGNYFHHNTTIWDSGATGYAGYGNNDATNQPNFLTLNTPPDYNTYHAPSTTASLFEYGTPSTENFSSYQTAGADVHGSVDTNYANGFPSVAITSPADQSTFAGLLTISASASDASGIRKVEFYVDWNLNATLTTAPFTFKWASAATATHTVAAMAYSNTGVRACNAVTLNLVGGVDPGGLVL